MQDLKTLLVNSVMKNLKIESDMFSVGMIEDAIDGIGSEQYKEFYNMLMGDDHDYLKPLDRVAKVAKHFKHSHADELFKETPTMAKECYELFRTVNAQITDHIQVNRKYIPHDRIFFENIDYSTLLDKHGAKVFSKQDLYVLDELGGGSWIMDIKFIANEKEAVDKIERIIKTAITAKYMKPKHEAISNNMRKLLR